MPKIIPNKRRENPGMAISKSLNFRRRRKKFNFKILLKIFLWAVQIAAVVALAYLLVESFFRTTKMTEESMEPTIQSGDTLILDRVIYKFKDPQPNDVIAFVPSGSLSNTYSVKRVIAVPGQTVEIKNGTVYVDDEPFTDIADVDQIEDGGLAGSGAITLKKGEYFVLGDNRNNSEDSRNSTIGNVTDDEIAGLVWFDLSKDDFGIVD